MNLEEYATQLSLLPMPESPQNLLVYGAPKTGKTTLVSQLARKYKVIWIDTEHGFQTLFSSVPKEFWPNIHLIRVNDSPEVPRAARMLTKLFRAKTPQKLCSDHGDIACPLCMSKPDYFLFDPIKLDSSWVLVIDSLTQLSDSSLAHALGVVDPLAAVIKAKTYAHWDNQGLILKGILTAQQRMPCHVVFISHEEEITHEDGTKKLTPVGGTRNFSATVARYFDHVVYLSIRNKKHCINSSTVSDIRVQAGSRNQVDVKTVNDFINIFQITYSEQGKKAALKFNAESEVVAELEAAEAAKVTQE